MTSLPRDIRVKKPITKDGRELYILNGLKMAIEGLRHSQNMTLTAVIGIGVILAALAIYILQRIDSLPGEFARINTMLSEAITASKQQPPQVLMMPPPVQPQQPAPAPAPTPPLNNQK